MTQTDKNTFRIKQILRLFLALVVTLVSVTPFNASKNKHARYPARAVHVLVACTCLAGLFLIFCGVAGAVTYGSGSGIEGIDSVVDGSYWSTLLSNNVSDVTVNVVVSNDAVLNLVDATITMRQITVQDNAVVNLINTTINMGNYNIYVQGNGTLDLSNSMIKMYNGRYINVNSGATMNVTDGSTITRRYSNHYYYFNYYSGSFGYVNDSTIEYGRRLALLIFGEAGMPKIY